MYALLDTCIFMDILFKREEYFEDSYNTFCKLKETKSRIYVSPTTLKDLYYFAKKATHNNNAASEIISRVYSIVSKIIDINANDTINAMFEDGDYEDNIIIEASKRNMLDCIITRNIKDYNSKGIAIFSPKDFLSKYQYIEAK